MVGSHHEGSALKRPRQQTEPPPINVVSSGDEAGEEQDLQQGSTRSPRKVDAGPATERNDQHEQGTVMRKQHALPFPNNP